MGSMGCFGVVGGDRRQLYAARFLREQGWTVLLAGWEQGEDTRDLPQVSLEELGNQAQKVLLPLPATRDGHFLNAPYSRDPIPLGDEFAKSLVGCQVYGGMVGLLRESSSLWEKIPLFDYFHREELTLGNAFLTAEGAVALAIQLSPRGLGGSRCLVTGFGRIGKALCLDLRGMGAQVDCAARKSKDLTAIGALGYGACTYGTMQGPYDVVFNTVPAPVLTESVLARLGPDPLVLELASAPGGVDRAAADRLGIRVEDAPSLPGRFSPQASGELIARTVCAMLEETISQ